MINALDHFYSRVDYKYFKILSASNDQYFCGQKTLSISFQCASKKVQNCFIGFGYNEYV